VLDANEIKLLIDDKPLPNKVLPPTSHDDGVQQVLKPEPGRPSVTKPGERPAPA
jgi:hypothetical protein